MNANANINDRGTGQGASPGEQGGQQPQVHFGCVEMIQSDENDVNELCGDAKKDSFAQYEGVKENKSGDLNVVQQTDFNMIQEGYLTSITTRQKV